MLEETEIYIKLLDGTSVLVPVKAQQIDDEKYLIKKNDYWDDEDFTAIWEFFPGDLVRVTKKDDLLIADCLIEYSTSISKRKLKELMFLIVDSMGEIPFSKIAGMKAEIIALCKESELNEQKHPIIENWIANNRKEFTSD